MRLCPLVAALCGATAAHAQSATPATSDSARGIDPVVVTATRTPTRLAGTTASVTRLSADQIAHLPVRTVADALQYVPGLVVLQGDGIGSAPRVVARGFYGGGETDYVTVLVDGVPSAELVGGAVNWDLVPLSSIAAIEVVRGGASSLYGDAAIGGVVNLITRTAQAREQWRVAGGGLGIAQAGGLASGAHGSVFGDVARSTGYRTHEGRVTTSVGGSLPLVHTPTHTLTLATLDHWRRYDDPGPLTDSAVAADRRDASPFFRFDDAHQRVNRLSLDGSALAGRTRTTGYVAGELARTDAVHTLPLSAAFADTKTRRIDSRRAFGSLQSETRGTWLGVSHRVVVGADASLGQLTSTYRGVLTGPAAVYAGKEPTPGAVAAKGTGHRTAAAGFASWDIAPTRAFYVNLGARYDHIADRYAPSAPASAKPSDATRDAWSPHVGANLEYAHGARGSGNVYAAFSRAFKAPTMDQLYDQRSTPVPFPPYAITTSNPTLVPQRARSVEGGIYHRLALGGDGVEARLSASTYQIDMRDELDFDIQQYRYVNIGRSRHRGLETGLTLAGAHGATAFGNLTLQSAVSRLGENEGKQLKAIPRRVFTGGVGRAATTGLNATLSATVVGDAFLDDANTKTLPGHTQFDLRTSYPIRAVRLTADVRNLFDSRYNWTGYPDPGGTNATLLYPAARRVVLVGLSSR